MKPSVTILCSIAVAMVACGLILGDGALVVCAFGPAVMAAILAEEEHAYKR